MFGRPGFRLLVWGLGGGDLLARGGAPDDSLRSLAVRAVDLFDANVREPIRDTAGSDPQAAARTVEAFETLLPAVTSLVSNHFRRLLLEEAERRIET